MKLTLKFNRSYCITDCYEIESYIHKFFINNVKNIRMIIRIRSLYYQILEIIHLINFLTLISIFYSKNIKKIKKDLRLHF